MPERQTLDRGVDARRLLQVVAALSVVVAATVASMFAWHRFGTAQPTAPRIVEVVTGAPALQTDPASDRAAYDAQKARELNSSGWIDRPQGVVHVPIERAMQLLAERGARNEGAN